MSFKEYQKEKVNQLLERVSGDTNIRFKFIESENIDDLIKYYVKEKAIDPRKVHTVLQDSCLTFDSLDYSEKNNESLHEDLIESGYILGRINEKHPGAILGITFDGTRYFYIGVVADISTHLKKKLNAYLKL